MTRPSTVRFYCVPCEAWLVCLMREHLAGHLYVPMRRVSINGRDVTAKAKLI